MMRKKKVKKEIKQVEEIKEENEIKEDEIVTLDKAIDNIENSEVIYGIVAGDEDEKK